MKLQQLRFACEVARQNLNLSEAAKVLHTSQPGSASRSASLEQELGVELFIRRGKRLVAVTEPGAGILDIAKRILRDTREPEAGRRAIHPGGGRQPYHRHHPHPGALCPAAGDPALHPALSRRAAVPAPGQPDADCAVRDLGGSRHLHRHRGHRTVPRPGDAALLPVESLHSHHAGTSAAEAAQESRWKKSRAIPSSPTTSPSPDARASTRPSRHAT